MAACYQPPAAATSSSTLICSQVFGAEVSILGPTPDGSREQPSARFELANYNQCSYFKFIEVVQWIYPHKVCRESAA